MKASICLDRGLGSVSVARRFIRDVLRLQDGVDDDTVETAMLLVSEVVTNALLHTSGPAELQVEVLDGTFRVRVADSSATRPVPVEPNVDEGGGFGLWMLDELSAGWGVDFEDGKSGKTVWFTMPLSVAVPDDAQTVPRAGRRRDGRQLGTSSSTV